MSKTKLVCMAIVVVTVAVYFKTVQHQFIDFDDPVYVTLNPRVSGGLTLDNLRWAFTAVHVSNWHPLTWLSHMLDVELFGMRPGLHHLVNVMLHSISVVLLFRFLSRVTAAPWRSLFVAALFALHPLHVESVAWVAERKDVLSGLFWMLTLVLYAEYAARPGRLRYLSTLACFAAGLLAKPMLVTLPVILLLLDWWPLNRLMPFSSSEGKKAASRLLIEKIPFFMLSALSSAVTIYAQHSGGAMKDLINYPLGLRLANAAVSYVKYVVKTVWPSDLALLYPFPESIPAWQTAGAVVFLVVVTGACWLQRNARPYLLWGWLWFLVTLLPVIGLVQVGGQSMADRYTYLPLTGLFILLAWGMTDLVQKWDAGRRVLPYASVLVVAMSAFLTWKQLGYWKDSLTIFRHTLAVTENNFQILNSMGITLYARGDYAGAELLYRRALDAWPKSATATLNLGAALSRQGRYEEAIEQYRRALQFKPDYPIAYGNLGKALAAVGKVDEALVHYEKALRLDPEMSRVRLNWAVLQVRSGMFEEAQRNYEIVQREAPYSADVALQMGRAWAEAGRPDLAARCYERAVRIDPGSDEARAFLMQWRPR